MLMPKRTKWRRPHRRKLGGEAHKGTKVTYGEFGLQATTGLGSPAVRSKLPVSL